MMKCLLAFVVVVAMAGSALAQTSSTTTTVSPYTGLEALIYAGMTPEQQNQYNGIQAYVNLSTQIVTAAYFQYVEKRFRNGETLNSYEQTILARGPMAITSGNQSFVTVGTAITASP
ncbi:hypothetical protein [Fundidesulfovibrio putealis]|uniref:hypothetical protein n=1 Tax=Fundidesulfovibrio putealis TaxID=270496 RepID=UPI00040F945F|nr:hypothetical protein [Fundidesulfovibrio putealis]